MRHSASKVALVLGVVLAQVVIAASAGASPVEVKVGAGVDYGIPAGAAQAVDDALSDRGARTGDDAYTVIAANWHGAWGLVSVAPRVLTTARPGEEDPIGDTAFSVIVALVDGRWTAATDGAAELEPILRVVPDHDLDPTQRVALFPSTETNATSAQAWGGYKFPWAPGPAWRVTQGWHNVAAFGYPANSSLDFDIVGAANANIIAAAPGTVTGMCRVAGGQVRLDITTDGTAERLGYLHLDTGTVSAAGVGLGSHVNQGQQLGQMRNSDGGSYTDACGTTIGTHLHLYFPSKPFTVDGVTFSDGDYHAGQNLYSTNTGVVSGDADGDGVLDGADACPARPGPVPHSGCPYYPFARHLERFNNGQDHYTFVGATPTGYFAEGTIGGDLSLVGGPGLHPLFACKVGGDTFTSIQSNCEGQAGIGVLGFAYDAQQSVPVTRQLFRCTVSANGEHFDSIDAACEGQHVEYSLGWILAQSSLTRWYNGADHFSIIGAAPGNDFGVERTFGDLLTVQVPGSHPLFACKVGGDTFTSPLANCEGQTGITLLGFAYDAPTTGPITRPVWRCATASNGEHFDSWNSNCEGQVVEQLLGYVLAEVSLNRWYNGSDHFSTNTMGAPIGYGLEYSLGNILGVNPPGTHPLYACKVGGDEFTSPLATCEGQAVVGLLGFIFDAQPAGLPTRALYRCTLNGSGEHFDSADPACEGHKTEFLLGWTMMGQANQLTVPGPPGAPTAAPGKRSATVSWSAPPSNGGSVVTAYKVTASPGGASCSWSGGPLTCTVSGLTAGTTYTFVVTATNTVGSGSASVPSNPAVPWDGAGYHALSPARVLDSRGPTGGWGTRLAAGTSRDLQVTVPGSVPASASAVVMNVTVTGASHGSFVSVWPSGTAQPTASSLNFAAGQTIPNLVTVKVGTGGKVSFANALGTVDVIADIVGYYDDGTGPGDLFTGITPNRLLDSRGSTGGWNAKLTAGAPRDLTVRQPGNATGVPATATAVIANVTVTGATAGSFVSTWPSGETQPTSSNLNFGAGETIPNLVVVKIGTNGAIRFANAVGAVDVIVDVVGYFDPTGGSRFHAISPTRILDDRVPTGLPGPWGPGATRALPVAGASGTNVPAGATGLVANVTATSGTAGSFIAVFPDGVALPNSSNVNFGPGQTIPNLVTVKVGTNGKIDFYNKAGTVDIIADAVGYYSTV